MTQLVTRLKVWLKRLRLRLFWPACLPSLSTLAFLLPPAIWPSPWCLPDNLSMTVVFGRFSFLAMALRLSLSLGSLSSFAFQSCFASSIFSSFNCWFFNFYGSWHPSFPQVSYAPCHLSLSLKTFVLTMVLKWDKSSFVSDPRGDPGSRSTWVDPIDFWHPDIH